jgi:beta-xylosidase
MPNGEWTIGELGRRLEHHEERNAIDLETMREEVKWTKRFAIGILGTAVLASLLNAALGLLRPPV